MHVAMCRAWTLDRRLLKLSLPSSNELKQLSGMGEHSHASSIACRINGLYTYSFHRLENCYSIRLGLFVCFIIYWHDSSSIGDRVTIFGTDDDGIDAPWCGCDCVQKIKGHCLGLQCGWAWVMISMCMSGYDHSRALCTKNNIYEISSKLCR